MLPYFGKNHPTLMQFCTLKYIWTARKQCEKSFSIREGGWTPCWKIHFSHNTATRKFRPVDYCNQML